MNNIYKFGGIGALFGSAVGALVGGIPGAVSLGQFGAGAGLEVGRWVYGDRVERLVNKIVKETTKTVKRVENFCFAVSIPCIVYWQTNKSMQEDCKHAQSLACSFYNFINLSLITCSAVTILYLMKKTTLEFIKEEQQEEKLLVELNVKDEASSDEEKEVSSFSKVAQAVAKASRKSVTESRKSLEW